MHGKMSKQNAWSTVQCCTQYHIRKCQLWSTASCAEHSNQTETCINRDPDDPTLCAYKCPAHPMNIHQVWSIASYCLQCTHQWSLTMETYQVWMEVEVNCLPACGNREIYMPALKKGHVKCTAYYCSRVPQPDLWQMFTPPCCVQSDTLREIKYSLLYAECPCSRTQEYKD